MPRWPNAAPQKWAWCSRCQRTTTWVLYERWKCRPCHNSDTLRSYYRTKGLDQLWVPKPIVLSTGVCDVCHLERALDGSCDC